MSDATIIREAVQPLTGSAQDYAERAAITKRLIAQRGFTVVAIEADWPDANRVHRYVRGASASGISANAAFTQVGYKGPKTRLG